MRKILFSVVCALASVSADAANIYGWNIKCVGPNDLSVIATQADDDFFIYHGDRDGRSERTWVSTYATNSNVLNLVFESDSSEHHPVRLTIARSKKGFGFAPGHFSVMNESTNTPVNCYVRYALDEESFDRISARPFPL